MRLAGHAVHMGKKRTQEFCGKILREETQDDAQKNRPNFAK